MSDTVEQRIEGFARRLEALNAEFEELKREAAGQAAWRVAPAPAVPAWLQHVDRLFRTGEDRLALREAERLRSTAVAQSSPSHLAELLAYLRQVETTERPHRDRLILLVVRSLQFIEPADARVASAPVIPPEPVVPAAPPAPVVPPPARRQLPAPPRVAPPVVRLPKAPSLPEWRPPRVQASDLLGPRALAIAGGIVTLLGIVFFFVLAVNRGWIGPDGRVALGAFASALVFAGGHVLRRKYGTTHSALAAVAAGMAGGYATLLSAAALFDLLPHWGALLGAAGIAGVGLVTALGWRSELVAGLGLVGAILVPIALITQSSLSSLGTAFAGAMFVATAIVGIRVGWRVLLAVGGLATAGQLVVLVSEPRYRFEEPASVLAVAAFVALAFLATGIAKQLRSKADGLDTLASTFTLAGAGLAVLSMSVLFATDEQRGLAFAAIVVVYALAGAFFFLRRATRDLSALLTFVTFSLGAVAVAELLTGRPLAYAWAAEAAGLAWLARRVREPRFQAWSVVYLLIALSHVLAVDARPNHLFVSLGSPADGASAALAVAAAAAVCSVYARPWTFEVSGRGLIAKLTGYWMAVPQPWLRRTTAWGAAAVAVYAASLWTLALFHTFDWGWVAVSGLWTGVGVLFGAGAIWRPALGVERGCLIWLGISAPVAVLRCLLLAPEQRAWTLVVVAVALLAASLAYQLVDRRPSPSMDASALLAAAGTAIGVFGTHALLAPEPRAYAWAAQSVVFAALAYLFAATHLRLLAIVVGALAAAETLASVAKPRQLLEPAIDPTRGVLTAVAVALALALIAAIPARDTRTYTTLAATAESLRRSRAAVRSALLWAAGAFATYAASLGVLALFSPSFEWGTVAVAGLWASIGAVVFGAGALRGSVGLRAGGLVWLAVTGALAVEQAARLLDPTPRAWSFAIVGVASLAVSVAYGLFAWRSSREQPTVTAVAGMATALALFAYPIGSQLAGRTQGAALLGVAAIWALVSATLFVKGSRNLSTLYWAVAVGLAATADAELLSGSYAVLGWAAAGVAVAWLARRVREPRLYGGAGIFGALTLGRAVIFQAPPTHLFVNTQVNPAAGAASLFIAALAFAAVAYLASDALRRLRAVRTLPWWLAGGLAVYGLSLVILDLAERISGGTEAGFQPGQTGVSAFWGLLALVLLYVGLKRGWRAIRFAGLALFPVVLAKIFFFDLPSLSSVTRAFSFLAVGFVLLLGGFFYQRLTSERDEPRGSMASR